MDVKDDEPWVVARSTSVAWRAGRVEVTSAVSGETFTAEHSGLLQVLHAFARPKSIQDAARELTSYQPLELQACIKALISARILTKASTPDLLTIQGWERSALAFHRTSRHPNLRVKRPLETLAVVPEHTNIAIPLRPPSVEMGRDFAHVLEARRSTRQWSEPAIDLPRFSTFLWMAARNRRCSTDKNRDKRVNRPYPSGGALYSLELYPVVAPDAVTSVPAGVYRYLPNFHGLEPIDQKTSSYVEILQIAARSAQSKPPPVAFLVSSRLIRQSEVYGDLAYSLVLKEVGGLFQTFYLVAEYLGLGGCALGCGVSDEFFSSIRNIDLHSEPIVGEFMLGPT